MLPSVIQDAVWPSILRNCYYAHSENLIVALLTSKVSSIYAISSVDRKTMIKLEAIMKELSEIETVADDEVKIGDICSVRFSEDTEIYRAMRDQ